MILKKEITGFRTLEHKAELCVVGGGMAGMTAAISAARHGVKVLIMQDRPVFGGNASSEIRMWIRGAGPKNRETGLSEEIALENIYRNPTMNYSIWDSVLYEKVMENENITMLLNCSCCDAEMDGDRIVSITGWQTTTQTWHKVFADIFADCSGDSVLAPLTGAEYRMGRESRSEFNEDIAPEQSDACTMGMSCLFQVREKEEKTTFIPPVWANHYTKEDFPYRLNISDPNAWQTDNYWWIEVGGTGNCIDDTENLRDRLLKIAFGVWDYIKNSGDLNSDYWELEWLGFLPGKRESRRYVGDYILNQNDIRSEGRFEDIIAYGGWSMDDHHPMGFDTTDRPTIWHPAPSPYGIPYRCLYSKNIRNLMFAGRNISATHTAMASCRVMATCTTLGQALGTAASVAIKEGITPREIYPDKIRTVQQLLMEDDCFLPFFKREKSELMERAKIRCNEGDVHPLFNGIDRPTQNEVNYWQGKPGSEIVISFDNMERVEKLMLYLDSDLERTSWNGYQGFYRDYPLRCNYHLSDKPLPMPASLLRSIAVYLNDGSGWIRQAEIHDNHKRLLTVDIGKEIKEIKIVPMESWGMDDARIYSVHLK